MAYLKLKTVFARWTEDNKIKAIYAVGDDDIKDTLNYDKGRAFAMFYDRLEDGDFNNRFHEYYSALKQEADERKANVRKRPAKVATNKIEEIDNRIKELESQISKLKAEREKEISLQNERMVKEARKMIDKLSDEQRMSLLQSLMNNNG